MVSSGAVSSPGPADSTSPGSGGSSHRKFDVRGSRRLTGWEEWFWYLLAGLTYIVCGIWQKFLLNWFIGPAWLVAFVVLGPAMWDRLRGRGRTSGDRP